ncbi:hypothetical protein NPIL_206911 [Nephila pilipes]|uniref:Uncharacterized protein n=1 Tax=Nephila pilipes TaxID=299642 RepID=A0A8X6TAJ9_NEPPI|nr:hypothetical protein NPIL_206911 [Nephila pilipes]
MPKAFNSGGTRANSFCKLVHSVSSCSKHSVPIPPRSVSNARQQFFVRFSCVTMATAMFFLLNGMHLLTVIWQQPYSVDWLLKISLPTPADSGSGRMAEKIVWQYLFLGETKCVAGVFMHFES